ncbi:hypothetical protein KI387_006697, partial [Taxus chinensis]
SELADTFVASLTLVAHLSSILLHRFSYIVDISSGLKGHFPGGSSRLCDREKCPLSQSDTCEVARGFAEPRRLVKLSGASQKLSE